MKLYCRLDPEPDIAPGYRFDTPNLILMALLNLAFKPSPQISNKVHVLTLWEGH